MGLKLIISDTASIQTALFFVRTAALHPMMAWFLLLAFVPQLIGAADADSCPGGDCAVAAGRSLLQTQGTKAEFNAPSCEDEFGPSNKPWDDFISCDDEKPYCSTNPTVAEGCKRTCGFCNSSPTPSPSPSPSCEDEFGPNNKPWDDFISCDAEKPYYSTNPTVAEGCKRTCGSCDSL